MLRSYPTKQGNTTSFGCSCCLLLQSFLRRFIFERTRPLGGSIVQQRNSASAGLQFSGSHAAAASCMGFGLKSLAAVAGILLFASFLFSVKVRQRFYQMRQARLAAASFTYPYPCRSHTPMTWKTTQATTCSRTKYST